jgi:PAS domain S-box-containing protein
MSADEHRVVDGGDLTFRQIVDLSPVLIHTARPDGYLDFFNRPWLDFVGQPLEKLLGWRWTAFIHPEDAEAFAAAMRESFAKGEPFEETSRVRRADGVYRWMLHRKVPQRDADGNVIKWFGSSIDIQERTRVEEELKTSAQLLQRNEFYLAEAQRIGQMGSWVFDPAEGFDYWSRELFRIHGLDPASETPSSEKYLELVHPQDREFMASQMKQLAQGGSGVDLTKRIVRPQGEVRYVRCVGSPLSDNGTMKTVGIGIDVTEHELLTKELRRREAYLADAQRLSHTGSFGWTPGSGKHVWSDETYRIFEYDLATDVTLDMIMKRVHPEDRSLIRELVERASTKGDAIDCEYRLLFSDGRVKYVRVLAKPLGTDSNELEFAGAVIDITEGKRAEETLRKSERELRTLIDVMPAFVGTALPDGSCDFLSENWLDYLGFTKEQGLGWGWASTIHPEDVERVVANWQAGLAAGEPVEQELRCRRADGVYRWFLNRDFPLRNDKGEIIKWYGVLFDIDEIKNSENKLRRVIDAIPTLAFCSFADGSKEFVNKGWLEYTGLSSEESHDWGWQVAFHPDDLPLVMKKWEEVLVSGNRGEIEARLRRHDGIYRWFLNRVEPFFDDAGTIVRWYGTSTDIDSLKQTEHALQMREHELLGIIETIPSMLWSTTPTGESTHNSQRLLEYVGVSQKEFVNRGWLSFVHPDDREESAKAFLRAIETGGSYNVIHRVRRSDDEPRWFQTRGEPLRDPDGKIIQWYGLSVDIDERKRAEDHLRDTRTKLTTASRIATVAELSASIAHELNQPLMAVLGNAQAAKRWLAADPPELAETIASIERILRDINSADTTMQHIRSLFKREPYEKSDESVLDIIRESVRFVLEGPNKRDVEVDWSIEGNLPLVCVDRIQAQQVFINLISNAMEATDGNTNTARILLRAFATQEHEVVVQVVDNGTGLEDTEKIFDAFMTTKEKGLGIGLAVSKTIIEAHGGRLWAENNHDGGATFHVALPVASKDDVQ